MSKKKKILIIAAVVLIVICAVILIVTLTGKTAKHDKKLNLSDISSMTRDTDMPMIIYADKEKVYIADSQFGFVIYDMAQKKVVDRCTYDEMNGICKDVGVLEAMATNDGKHIYFGERLVGLSWEYNTKSQKYKSLGKLSKDIYIPTAIAAGYNSEYDQYFDLNYDISDTIGVLDDSFVYLRLDSEGKLENLQLVRCYNDKDKQDIMDVFK
ncbi:MAG: hypothetical protein Q4A45_08185 [Clostridia bacterium]|nr:hypothetical protein [Clostridia bacterium]